MTGRSPTVEGRPRQRSNATGDETRRRLIQTVTQLVATKSYDAVSIRDITTAARTDVTAVHYHFGSKRELVASALRQFLEEAATGRAPHLAALRDNRRPAAVDIARCLVVPAAERLTRTRRGRNQNAFVESLMHHREFASTVESSMTPDIEAYIAALQRALPGVATGVLFARLRFSIGVVQRELAQPQARAGSWPARYGVEAPADRVEALIHFIAGGLKGG